MSAVVLTLKIRVAKNYNIGFLLSVCQNNHQKGIAQAKRGRSIVPNKQPGVVLACRFLVTSLVASVWYSLFYDEVLITVLKIILNFSELCY